MGDYVVPYHELFARTKDMAKLHHIIITPKCPGGMVTKVTSLVFWGVLTCLHSEIGPQNRSLKKNNSCLNWNSNP